MKTVFTIILICLYIILPLNLSYAKTDSNEACQEGLVKIFKTRNNSSACVKPESLVKLIERQWGYAPTSNIQQNISGAQSFPRLTTQFIHDFEVSGNTKKLIIVPNGGIGFEGQEIKIDTKNQQPVIVYDVYGNKIYEGSTPKFLKLNKGHYFIECDGDRHNLAILPDNYIATKKEFIFGDPPLGSTFQDKKYDIINPEFSRIHSHSAWVNVEPTKNEMHFSKLDALVEKEFNNDRKIILTLFTRPDWVSDENFNNDFVGYAKKLTERYKGKIWGIQVLNEPWFKVGQHSIPGDDFNSYLQNIHLVLVQSSIEIKKIDSKIKVIGPSFDHNGHNFEKRNDGSFSVLDPLLKIEPNFLNYIDYYSFHDDNWDIMPDEDSKIERIDKRIERLESKLNGKQIIITESKQVGESALGIITDLKLNPGELIQGSGISWQDSVIRVLKNTIMWKEGPILTYNWHVMTLAASEKNPLEFYGFDQGERGPHPRLTAFLLLVYLLDDANFVTKEIDNSKFYYVFEKNGEEIKIMWSTPNNVLKHEGTTIFGRHTSLIGTEPVVLN